MPFPSSRDLRTLPSTSAAEVWGVSREGFGLGDLLRRDTGVVFTRGRAGFILIYGHMCLFWQPTPTNMRAFAIVALLAMAGAVAARRTCSHTVLPALVSL